MNIGKIINKLSWGQFLVGKVQFVIVLITMLGVFEVPTWICIISAVPVLIVVFIIGHFFDKYWRKPYLDAHYKNVKIER